MKDHKPNILICNDDGINAPGIRTLITTMKQLGNVTVVAPDSPQSGMGHAVTINSTLYINEIKTKDNHKEYSCSGTPADCVKIAVNQILKKKPDICVSGINHGSNASINVIYSGTVSAAVEAGLDGIPSVAFSSLDYNWDTDFSHTIPFIKNIAEDVLKNKLPKGVILNVNIPNNTVIKGIRLCRQAKAYWEEKFYKRVNPHGREYYWLSGNFINLDEAEDTDIKALENGYISVVPTQMDLTAYKSFKELENRKIYG